jgi:hypothetical protein
MGVMEIRTSGRGGSLKGFAVSRRIAQIRDAFATVENPWHSKEHWFHRRLPENC